MRLTQGKVRGSSLQDTYTKLDGIKTKEPVFQDINPNQVDGEGYPHGIIWINGKDKKNADAMIINTGHKCFEFWVRQKPERVPRTSNFIHWKHTFNFHDYELEELAKCVIERVCDEEILMFKRVRAEL